MSAEILPIANKNCWGWSSTAFRSPRRPFSPCGFVWWKSLIQEAWDFVIDQLSNFKENDYILLKVFLHLFECFFFSFLKVQPNSSNLVYNTLLELYLNDAARQKNVEAQVEHERKALDLLKNVEVWSWKLNWMVKSIVQLTTYWHTFPCNLV